MPATRRAPKEVPSNRNKKKTASSTGKVNRSRSRITATQAPQVVNPTNLHESFLAKSPLPASAEEIATAIPTEQVSSDLPGDFGSASNQLSMYSLLSKIADNQQDLSTRIMSLEGKVNSVQPQSQTTNAPATSSSHMGAPFTNQSAQPTISLDQL